MRGVPGARACATPRCLRASLAARRVAACAALTHAVRLLCGAQSDTHVVLAALKRASSELSSFQPKVFKIDEHLGISVSGLTADGRVLCRFMRNECVNHAFVYEAPLAVGRLVQQVADRSQANTQRSWKRPYGVGLLVAGFDATGPHLYQTCPSGNYYEYKAMAIGARSQASKTYLEKTFTQYPPLPLADLCRHALLALREACGEGELSAKNVTLAFVGKDAKFTTLEGAALAPYLSQLEPPADAQPAPPAAEGADAQADAAMAADAPPPPADGGAAPMEG